MISKRYLSPTYATDSRNEHSQTVRFPSVQLSLNGPAAGLKLIRAAIQPRTTLRFSGPQVDTRLTPRSNFGQITHNATY